MRLLQRRALVCCIFFGYLLLSGVAYTATPTPEQLQLLQQMSAADVAKLEQAVKDRQLSGVSPAVAELPAPQSVILPRDPYVVDEPAATAPLKPFGYDLFAGEPTTFVSAGDIPLTADYRMGRGDVVEVQLFGSTNASYSLRVDRRGTITFPSVGAITVAGMDFDDMRSVLKQRVAEQFIGVEASISLGELRSIRVFVLGDVQRPGSYVVSSLSTMTNALFVSGGIKLIGSLRDIQLKRAGKRVSRLDLYALLLRGDTQNDRRLQHGDVIFVPPIGTTVSMAGEVRRPAIYELRREQGLAEVIKLAGGLLPGAYPDEVRLERINNGSERILMDVDLGDEQGQATRLRDGDSVHVYSVLEKLENVVMLAGHVRRPLAYQWREGLRLTDIIADASVLEVDADLEYVLIRRQDKIGQGERLLSASLRAALADPQGEADILLRANDRVVVFSLAAALEEGGGDQDQDLKRDGVLAGNRQAILTPLLDKVRELATTEGPARVISVRGHVRFAGAYPLVDAMRVSDLIRAAGRLRESAYTLKAELTRSQVGEGQVRSIEHIEIDLAAVLVGEPEADLLLQPHDYLSIREIPQWHESEYIEVRGEVLFPGRYSIRQGEALADIVQRAGGLTHNAYVDGAVFVREKLREREREQFNRMADDLERELAGASLHLAQASADQQQAYQFRRQLVERLRQTEAVGRLVLDLGAVLAGKGEANHVSVLDGDALYIPQRDNEITVVGEVFFPTSHLFQRRDSRNAYIGNSGGLTANADGKRIYVVRANGIVESGGNRFWSRQPKIRAGDTIVVPLDADRVDPLRLWSSVTQIMYQLALTAASMKTLGLF